jgi:putative acetyltransferase
MENITILNYAPELNHHFKTINVEWIQRYFKVEPHDEEQLDHAQSNIIDKGGYIFFGALDGEIVGTAALIYNSPEEYELAKMGVRPQAQGKGVALALMEYAIQFARDLGAKQLFLETNSSLTPAITLYKKVGFVKIPQRSTDYARSDYQMILVL